MKRKILEATLPMYVINNGEEPPQAGEAATNPEAHQSELIASEPTEDDFFENEETTDLAEPQDDSRSYFYMIYNICALAESSHALEMNKIAYNIECDEDGGWYIYFSHAEAEEEDSLEAIDFHRKMSPFLRMFAIGAEANGVAVDSERLAIYTPSKIALYDTIQEFMDYDDVKHSHDFRDIFVPFETDENLKRAALVAQYELCKELLAKDMREEGGMDAVQDGFEKMAPKNFSSMADFQVAAFMEGELPLPYPMPYIAQLISQEEGAQIPQKLDLSDILTKKRISQPPLRPKSVKCMKARSRQEIASRPLQTF